MFRKTTSSIATRTTQATRPAPAAQLATSNRAYPLHSQFHTAQQYQIADRLAGALTLAA